MVYSGFGDDAAFNAGVQRIDPVPAAQAHVRDTLAMTGALKRPLVIQFNHNDPTIVPHMQTVYPQLAVRAGARRCHACCRRWAKDTVVFWDTGGRRLKAVQR